ncbi:MAG: LysM peptidoglycan-binding domain-containing protein [Pirellulales bacterium]
MPVGKKLVVVASVLATGAGAAFFFRKDASQITTWQEALDNSPFRQRVERRVAEDGAWAANAARRVESVSQPNYRIPTAETAAIVEPSPGDTTPAFQKSFHPVGSLLEPIATEPDPHEPEAAPHGENAAANDFAVQPLDGGAPQSHTIADGDTLSRLAEQYLGRSERYLEIFELNRGVLSSPDLLPIGVVLKIPPRDVSSDRGAGVPRGAFGEMPAEAAPPSHLVPVAPQALVAPVPG